MKLFFSSKNIECVKLIIFNNNNKMMKPKLNIEFFKYFEILYIYIYIEIFVR